MKFLIASVSPKFLGVVTLLLAALCLSPALRATAAPPAPQDVQKLFNNGAYSFAVNALQTDASTAPDNAALQYWLGRCFYELRDYSHAASSFERAVAIAPNLSEYHDWLGRAYGLEAQENHSLSSLDLARRADHEFTTAVELDSSNVDAQRDLIGFLIRAPGIVGGSKNRAAKQIEALAAIDPLQSRLAEADLLASRKRYEDASTKYQQILALRPRSVDACLEIADYYRERNDPEHFRQAVAAAADLAPADPRLLFYSGVSLVMLKQDAARAEQDLRQYLDRVPDNSEVPSHALTHDWLGRLFVGQGKLDAAVAQYGAEVALDPHNKAAQETLSRLKREA